MNESKIIKSHGEDFNLDILKFREIKKNVYKDNNSKVDVADSNAIEEECEVVSLDEALSFHESEDSEACKVDQNSRVSPRLKSKKNSQPKNGSREISLILEKDVFEYASNFGSGARKNASAGSGIKKMIQRFFSMKKREDHQLRRIELVLRLQEDSTHKLAQLIMKKATPEEVSDQELEVLKFSKDVVYYTDLFGFNLEELTKLIPNYLHSSLADSFTRVTNYTREKRLQELHGSL